MALFPVIIILYITTYNIKRNIFRMLHYTKLHNIQLFETK